MSDETIRAKIERALAKPLPERGGVVHSEVFDPWQDIITGIHGSYSPDSDDLMIGAMEAVRDRATFAFIEKRGFVGEFMLYVLSGHGLTEYGTSPRGAWADFAIADLWQALIDKWRGYADVVWDRPSPSSEKK